MDECGVLARDGLVRHDNLAVAELRPRTYDAWRERSKVCTRLPPSSKWKLTGRDGAAAQLGGCHDAGGCGGAAGCAAAAVGAAADGAAGAARPRIM